MRFIIAILFFTACGKKTDVVEYHAVDSILIESARHTDTIAALIPKVDEVIHEREQKNAADIRAYKILRDSAKVFKTIIIRDTIVIREKTNFWGRKRVTTDSMQSIDSSEYEKNH